LVALATGHDPVSPASPARLADLTNRTVNHYRLILAAFMRPVKLAAHRPVLAGCAVKATSTEGVLGAVKPQAGGPE
jgi:hypothetical protein